MIRWTELVSGTQENHDVISNVHQFEPLHARVYYARVQVQDEPDEVLDIEDIKKLPMKEATVMLVPGRPKLMNVYLDSDPQFAYLIEEVDASEVLEHSQETDSD